MKLSELRQIIREELESVMDEQARQNIKERTVASRVPPRKMTPSQVSKRDKIGKAMLKKPAVVTKFKREYADDWEYWIWATATNAAIGE